MVFGQLASAWGNPSDVLTLLLLLGGDVVQRALAQHTGHKWSLVVFSFGWVTYSFVNLLAAVGENKLLPTPDVASVVVNVGSGFARENQSWMIGRIIRDFERLWIEKEAKEKVKELLSNEKKETKKKGLCISVYTLKIPVGKDLYAAKRDKLWYSGFLVAIVQLIIASIPGFRWQEWDTLLITAIGTFLAFVSGILPQWRRERWACRKSAGKSFAITRGNGAQHVLVILGNKENEWWDLEELARAGEGMSREPVTRWASFLLVACWICLLISVQGVKKHIWFLISIGSIGMVHTVIVAGLPRDPTIFGFHLEFVESYANKGVMKCLLEVEEAEKHRCKNIGWSLVPIFFPGDITPEETRDWANASSKAKDKFLLPVQVKEATSGEGAQACEGGAQTRVDAAQESVGDITPEETRDWANASSKAKNKFLLPVQVKEATSGEGAQACEGGAQTRVDAAQESVGGPLLSAGGTEGSAGRSNTSIGRNNNRDSRLEIEDYH